MTRKQQRWAQKYVDLLLPKLGLDGWEVTVDDEDLDPDGGPLASCDQLFGRKKAAMWFRADFFLAPPDFQRHVIVHELLHCVHAQPQRLVFETLGFHIPAAKHGVFSDMWRMAHEYSIDSLAGAIAPCFPLPEAA